MDETWLGCLFRTAAAGVLIVIIGVGGVVFGSAWTTSTAIGAAAVGTWYVSLATHELRVAVTLTLRRRHGSAGGVEWRAGAGAAVGLAVCLLTAGVAAAGRSSALVVSFVSVVVANGTFVSSAFLRYRLKELGSWVGEGPALDAIRSATATMGDREAS